MLYSRFLPVGLNKWEVFGNKRTKIADVTVGGHGLCACDSHRHRLTPPERVTLSAFMGEHCPHRQEECSGACSRLVH